MYNGLAVGECHSHVLEKDDRSQVCKGLVRSGTCHEVSPRNITYNGNRNRLLRGYALKEFLQDVLLARLFVVNSLDRVQNFLYIACGCALHLGAILLNCRSRVR